MSGPMLRPAAPGEAASLAEVHADAFPHPWPADDLAGLLAHPGTFALAAEEAGRLQGFILVRRVLDEAEVLTLAVRPPARRGGLGAALLEAATRLLARAGAAELILEVAVDNAAALALYRRAGFAEAGRRRGYYARADARPVDAQVMRRRLNTGAA